MTNIQIEDVVRETVKVLDEQKQCHSCIHSNRECNWCAENKINISPFQYGCRKHITNEQAVRRLAELEHAKYCKELKKMTLDMDIMGYAISAASIMLEKVDSELERQFNSVKHKTDEEIRSHAESKRNRERLRKAYAKMKFAAMDIRNTYDRYIEYFFNCCFTDSDGKYDGVESDKNLANSGVISKVIKVFVDRALDNPDNAEKIMDFMLSLEGSGIYEEQDFNNGIIRLK